MAIKTRYKVSDIVQNIFRDYSELRKSDSIDKEIVEIEILFLFFQFMLKEEMSVMHTIAGMS